MMIIHDNMFFFLFLIIFHFSWCATKRPLAACKIFVGGEKRNNESWKKQLTMNGLEKNNNGREPRVLTISCSTYGSSRPLAFAMFFCSDVFWRHFSTGMHWSPEFLFPSSLLQVPFAYRYLAGVDTDTSHLQVVKSRNSRWWKQVDLLIPRSRFHHPKKVTKSWQVLYWWCLFFWGKVG